MTTKTETKQTGNGARPAQEKPLNQVYQMRLAEILTVLENHLNENVMSGSVQVTRIVMPKSNKSAPTAVIHYHERE